MLAALPYPRSSKESSSPFMGLGVVVAASPRLCEEAARRRRKRRCIMSLTVQLYTCDVVRIDLRGVIEMNVASIVLATSMYVCRKICPHCEAFRVRPSAGG